MAGLQIETQPVVEPILLADAKNYLKVDFTEDDVLISGLIMGARELVEGFTGRSLVNKGYIQTLDAFPYFTDSVQSQMAYPPSYYSLPRYSTTLWNYSQMIKLLVSPLTKVKRISYLASADKQWHSLLPADPPWKPGVAYALNDQVMDGNGNVQQALNSGTSGDNPPTWATNIGGTTSEGTPAIVWQNIRVSVLNELSAGGLSSNTFFPDPISEPPRLFPGPAGSFWPSVLYVPNAVEIHFTAGYGDAVSTGSPVVMSPPANIPWRCTTAMYQLLAGWYENRESITPLNMKEMPNHVKALLWNVRVYDMQPTRG